MINLLKELNFSDKEARVYLALLEMGPSSVSSVARKAKINRTTAYDILEELASKKLVRMAEQRGKMIYVAESPENIQKVLTEESERYKKMADKAQTALPELKGIYSEIEKKPIVKFYEGLDGLKELYEDSLNNNNDKTILAYTSSADLQEVIWSYIEEYYRRRKEKGISIRAIMPTNEYSLKLKKIGKDFLREVRLVPPDRFNFSPEIYLYDNKLTLMSLREKFGVYIESKEIVEALKKAYELSWEAAKRYDQEIEEKIKNNEEIFLAKGKETQKKKLDKLTMLRLKQLEEGARM